VGGHAGELVARDAERELGVAGYELAGRLGEAPRGVQPGAHCRAAQGQRI